MTSIRTAAAANAAAAALAGVGEAALRTRMEAESAQLRAEDVGRRDHEHMVFAGTILTALFIPHYRKKTRDADDAFSITDYCRCAVPNERDVLAALEQSRPAIPSTVLRRRIASDADVDTPLGELFIGGFSCGRNVKWLRSHRVRAVVNCAREMELFADHAKKRARLEKGKRGAAVLDLGWEDSLSQTLDAATVQRAIRFVHDARLRGDAALIHCAAGRSRSTSLVVAYLVATSRAAAASASADRDDALDATLVSVDDALAHLQSRRLVAKPNVHFMAQLRALDAAEELRLV